MLVGCDRSSSARPALEWAATQLRGHGRLVLVHACQGLHAPPSVLSTPQERIEEGHAVIDELLMEAAEALLEVDVEVEVEVLDEDPVSAILEAAERHGAEAIVIGSTHRSRLRSAIGTVTRELLKATPVPLIAVAEAVAGVGSSVR
jgi:nucleotide-binding universal stress UspA family protein